MRKSHLLVAENAAGISDRVHSDPARYREVYRRMGERLSGFPGLWSLIAECALELERQHRQEWQDGWIETCWAIGDLILDLEEPIPARELVSRALQSQTQQQQSSTERKEH